MAFHKKLCSFLVSFASGCEVCGWFLTIHLPGAPIPSSLHSLEQTVAMHQRFQNSSNCYKRKKTISSFGFQHNRPPSPIILRTTNNYHLSCGLIRPLSQSTGPPCRAAFPTGLHPQQQSLTSIREGIPTVNTLLLGCAMGVAKPKPPSFSYSFRPIVPDSDTRHSNISVPQPRRAVHARYRFASLPRPQFA